MRIAAHRSPGFGAAQAAKTADQIAAHSGYLRAQLVFHHELVIGCLADPNCMTIHDSV